jgi:hypothetical protein
MFKASPHVIDFTASGGGVESIVLKRTKFGISNDGYTFKVVAEPPSTAVGHSAPTLERPVAITPSATGGLQSAPAARTAPVRHRLSAGANGSVVHSHNKDRAQCENALDQALADYNQQLRPLASGGALPHSPPPRLDLRE